MFLTQPRFEAPVAPVCHHERPLVAKAVVPRGEKPRAQFFALRKQPVQHVDLVQELLGGFGVARPLHRERPVHVDAPVHDGGAPLPRRAWVGLPPARPTLELH